MKRLVLVFLFLLAVGITIGLREGILDRILGRPEHIGHVTVKNFSFQTPNSLEEWDEKALTEHRTGYIAAEYKKKNCVKAVSRNSASALYFKQKLFHERWPYVSWDWIVERFPAREGKEALDCKEEFDFAAQVYVIFYARGFLNMRAIQYVWTEELPAGAVSDSPYTENVKLIVLQSGPSEEWKHEERNIRDDFRALFGEELKKDIAAVAFMTDSDSTESSAVAYYDDMILGLAGRPAKDKTERGSH